MMRGALLAGLSSGAGKTVITAGILGALRKQGIDIIPAKSGPDYIDPHFLRAASHKPCLNLDHLAMRHDLAALIAQQQASHILIEGAMGLFDGSDDGLGSSQKLAEILHLPIILTINAKAQAQNAVIMARAMMDYMEKHHPLTPIQGVIFNHVSSQRHQQLITQSAKAHGVPLLGMMPNMELQLKSRHLGLVQAMEMETANALSPFLDEACQLIETHIGLDKLLDIFAPCFIETTIRKQIFPLLGQNIAIAYDEAFAFIYQHICDDWHNQGVSLSFFSPLKDEPAPMNCDAIYLPGGYPELYGETLANAHNFKQSMHDHANKGHIIYGECGGFMCLGETLFDKTGQGHDMLGLLPLQTSFQEPKLTLSYHQLTGLKTGLFANKSFIAHEFHYSKAIYSDGKPLFEDDKNQIFGLSSGNIAGSYAHLIAPKII